LKTYMKYVKRARSGRTKKDSSVDYEGQE